MRHIPSPSPSSLFLPLSYFLPDQSDQARLFHSEVSLRHDRKLPGVKRAVFFWARCHPCAAHFVCQSPCFPSKIRVVFAPDFSVDPHPCRLVQCCRQRRMRCLRLLYCPFCRCPQVPRSVRLCRHVPSFLWSWCRRPPQRTFHLAM